MGAAEKIVAGGRVRIYGTQQNFLPAEMKSIRTMDSTFEYVLNSI